MPEASIPYSGATTLEYSVSREHSRSEGLIVLPIAGPPPQAASVIRLHAPIEMEVVYWAAVRRGGAPIVPSAESFSGNANRVFLGGQRSAILPVPVMGGHAFGIMGFWVYALINAEGMSSNFVLGSMPWEDINVNENFIPAAAFDPTNIIGTALPGSVNPLMYFQPKQFLHPLPLQPPANQKPSPPVFTPNQWQPIPPLFNPVR